MAEYRSSLLLILLTASYVFFFSSKQELSYAVDLTPVRKIASRNQNIQILVVINANSDGNEYRFPLTTIKCYARRHNYTLTIVRDDHYAKECHQMDYMFRRHCISSIVLNRSPSTEWLLFLDADISVANPERLVEEYLDEKAELIMYDRFMRTPSGHAGFSWNLLIMRSNYPNSFHGTDNGAIHTFIIRELQPLSLPRARLCYKIWEESTGYDDLFLYEACARVIMGAQDRLGPLKIIPKGRGWVRDGWITQSRWSLERDFMLHGFKSSDRRYRVGIRPVNFFTELLNSRFMWYSFLQEDLDPEECKWNYDQDLLVPASVLDSLLIPLHRITEKRFWRVLALLSGRF